MRELIPLILDKRASKDHKIATKEEKKRITAIVDEILNYDQKLRIISDNLRHLDNPNVFTHDKAKGSNDLHDKNIVTIIQYLSPVVYSRLCLLAEEFKITDIVKTYYRDCLFQAIGRNRGYRRGKDSNTLHYVIMNSRLHSELGKHKLTEGHRYQLCLQLPFWK